MEYEMGGPLCATCSLESGYTGTKYETEIFFWLTHLQQFGIIAGTLTSRKMLRAESLLMEFINHQSSRNQKINSYKFYRSMVSTTN